MAAPTYTTDLTTIVDFDGTPASPTVAEPASGWTAGRSPTTDTDFPIQGTNHASLTMNTTGKAGILCTNASTWTWNSSHYLFGWIVWLAPGAIDTKANGGVALLAGPSSSAYRIHYVGGKDFGSYPYGGWQNFIVDPLHTGGETDVGTVGTTDFHVVGAGANVLSSVAKGNPLGFDVFRYGRGEFRVAAGESGNYATFAGMATTNDNTSNRWGLFQGIDGGYRLAGHMILGYAALVNFVDANKTIVVQNTPDVNSTFHKIEIRNASSVVSWDNISITQLGVTGTYTTASKCNLVVTDNADVDFLNCTFTDMSTFSFLSNTLLSGNTWRRCGQVTQGGATITNCLFVNTTDAVSVLADDIDLITNTDFVSDGSNHAIQLTSAHAGGSYSLTNVTFTNYATSDGSTGNEAIYNNSGGHVNINISGGTYPYVRNGSGATTTVTANYAFTITGLELNTEVTVVTAGTATELYHVENASTSDGSGKYKIVYTHSGGGTVDVLIHHVDYIPDISNIYSLTLPSTDSSTKVTMFYDDNYSNP